MNTPPVQKNLYQPASIPDSLPKVPERFKLSKKIGQGTFSFIYEAFDTKLEKNVALKIEKKDKNKNILYFEYEVLKALKSKTGLHSDNPHVCEIYDFVKSEDQNFIVMQLEGPNLTRIKRTLDNNFILRVATKLLLQMLEAIEQVHERGFIHRDVKASNFVLSKDKKNVFIVDFGLAKQHLKRTGQPVAQRKQADFRGTVSFASLNAHNSIDLSRRDDMWSFYFVLLDFYNESLIWREKKNLQMDEVRDIKAQCLGDPKRLLWRTTTKYMVEVHNIFYHLMKLNYKDKPDYNYIRNQLLEILRKELEKESSSQAQTMTSDLKTTATSTKKRLNPEAEQEPARMMPPNPALQHFPQTQMPEFNPANMIPMQMPYQGMNMPQQQQQRDQNVGNPLYNQFYNFQSNLVLVAPFLMMPGQQSQQNGGFPNGQFSQGPQGVQKIGQFPQQPGQGAHQQMMGMSAQPGMYNPAQQQVDSQGAQFSMMTQPPFGQPIETPIFQKPEVKLIFKIERVEKKLKAPFIIELDEEKLRQRRVQQQ